MSREPALSLLFVCLGNICRSPTLMAALRHLASEKGLSDKIHVDSCGLGWFHLGERPDPRSFEAAKKRGILIDHKAEQFQEGYFDGFDYIFAVDEDIAQQLKSRARSPEHQKKVYLATAFSKKYKNLPIPDPYYMTGDGFAQVVDISIDACEGILRHIHKSLI